MVEILGSIIGIYISYKIIMDLVKFVKEQDNE
jgi:uncharacterized protein YneF (UPF0154 family)